MAAGGQTLGATGFGGAGAGFCAAHGAGSGSVSWQASNAIFAVLFQGFKALWPHSGTALGCQKLTNQKHIDKDIN